MEPFHFAHQAGDGSLGNSKLSIRSSLWGQLRIAIIRKQRTLPENDIDFANVTTYHENLAKRMVQSITKVVFWGVRGSTPAPGPHTSVYGGNTVCVEVATSGSGHFILDCGTGIRALGNSWSQGQFNGDIVHTLVTHYHWDHIQGIPFFRPFFEAQNLFHFYGFQSKHLGRDSFRKVIETQFSAPYFPKEQAINLKDCTFREVTGGEKWEAGGTQITAAWLNHPQGCLGYRLDTAAGSIVYATDHEPGVSEFDRNLSQLADNADVLIYDAQYSPEQVATNRKGWGHSSWLDGVKLATESNVKNLILFHHDPTSSDKIVDQVLSNARNGFRRTWAAAEGMSLILSDQGVEAAFAVPKPSIDFC